MENFLGFWGNSLSQPAVRKLDEFRGSQKGPNHIDKFGSNLLMAYLANTHLIDVNVVAHILTRSDIQHTDKKGYSVLHYAVFTDSPLKVFQLLLESGADVNYFDLEGKNALEWYLLQKTRPNSNIIKSLLRAGFDFQLMNQSDLLWLQKIRQEILDITIEETWLPIKQINLLRARSQSSLGKVPKGPFAEVWKYMFDIKYR